MVHFMFIAPMHSYVTNVLVYNLHITIFSRVYSYVLVCYSCVLVCYSCVVLVTIVLVCTWLNWQPDKLLLKGFFVCHCLFYILR